MRHIESHLIRYWSEQGRQGGSKFPYEYFFNILDEEELQAHYQIPVENSWLKAAKDKGIPIVSPGAEDSTIGNMFTARVMEGRVASHSVLKSGTEQLQMFAEWYQDACRKNPIGFFQLGGGIAGDFAICAVPMLIQDLKRDVPLWAYFAQISDAVTSYGGYSGALPNEKITWTKLSEECPKFMIQSDATIVAPLIFAYVLGQ